MTICLHSLWRSCSTYFALKFRNPDFNTYWYYEPYNEALNKLTPDISCEWDNNSWESHHPDMNKAYYFEYLPLIRDTRAGVELYNASFAYERYFPNDAVATDEKKYLNSLVAYAKGQNKTPVLAFCRSLGRVGHLRYLPQSVHITQYRNPHQVLKSFEDVKFINMLSDCINNSSKKSLPLALGLNTPPSIKESLSYSNRNVTIFHDIFDRSEATSFFFEFYVVANFSAFFFSDIILNINRVAEDKKYREKTLSSILKLTGLEIHFDDIEVRNDSCTRVYDPQKLESAIDKYIGTSEKIERFKCLLEEISGVTVVRECAEIENIRDEILELYAISDAKMLRRALNTANCTISECADNINKKYIEYAHASDFHNNEKKLLVSSNDKLVDELSCLKKQCDDLEQKCVFFESENGVLSDTCSRLTELCALKERTLAESQRQLDRVQQEAEEKYAFFEQQLQTASCEQSFIRKALEVQLKELRDEKDTLLTGFERQLEEARAEKDCACTALENQLDQVRHGAMHREAHANSLQKRIAALESSLSWKVTAPLRFVARGPMEFAGVVKRKYTLFRHRPLLEKAAVFDPVYYMQNNPDVMCSGQDALTHFILDGWKEGRNPSADFDMSWYLKIYPDVARGGGNPLLHYALYGRQEGRSTQRYVVASHAMVTPPAALAVPPDSAVATDVSKRILVVDTVIPRPDVHAGELATFGMLKTLCAKGFDVVYIPLNMESNAPYEEPLVKMGVQCITREGSYCTPQQYVEEQGHTFGIFYLMRVECAEPLLAIIRRCAPYATVIYSSADLYFLRESRQAALNNDSTLREKSLITRERELAMMRDADLAVVISPVEQQILLEYLPPEKVVIFQGLYAPISEHRAGFNDREGIFYLGGFNHPPNVDAMLWFVKEIWPSIHKRMPDVFFHIVGAQMPDNVKELGREAGVKIEGFVPDLQPLLGKLRVGVVPLRYGAGIKGKVAVSMGAGIPCVCTSMAAEGMGLVHGCQAFIADDEQGFTEAVVSLYRDRALWEAMSKRAYSHVVSNFGEEANSRSLLRLFRAAHCLPLEIYVAHCRSLQPRALPELAPNTSPDVSIIIPVFNQWSFTRDCLNSVLEDIMASKSPTVEIILADDGSTDATVNAEKHFPGLRIVKNEENGGFLLNVNNAAKYATGKYLLLLNNDTIVLPGWLCNLYKNMEADSSVAIVGSKMLYPDGSIQEAGGMLFRDASAVQCGHCKTQYDQSCTAERFADYCSGCSILIRRSFWIDSNGFDERYSPAYYEDTDLCMRAVQSGYFIVYIPESEVIHFESQSHKSQAKEKMIFNNKAKFYEKWSKTLNNYLDSSASHKQRLQRIFELSAALRKHKECRN